MEQLIEEELKSLSLEQIRQELVNRGEKVGPLMPTMRHLFEKKLARRIMRERGLEITEEDGLQSSIPEITVEKPAQKSQSSSSEVEQESNLFYAVSLPQDLKGCQERLVFTDKKEAMKTMKLMPGCRFKIFKDMESANAFTKVWAEDIVASPRPPEAVSKLEVKSEVKKEETKRSFKEPTRAERIGLKSAVETGDIQTMLSLVWSNPHYLISVGESPVVLHEAFRYNALHLAAKFNQPDVCRHVLATINNSDFHQLLYPEDSEATRRNRIRHLVDLFLNMPDKGGGDSALHFACKFGHPEVVEVLLKYSQCDKRLGNKMGMTPYDVINSRSSNPDPEVGDRIRKLLRGLVYVPLYRAMGCVPVVGQPVSEAELKDRTLKAYAGPMTPEKAQTFYRSWAVFPPNSPQQKQKEIRQTKRSDYDKGLERLGRNLASEFDISWSEYWEFLSDFADLRTPEGLQMLEQYLVKRDQHLAKEPDLNGNNLSLEKNSGDGCCGDIQTPEGTPKPRDTSSPSNELSPSSEPSPRDDLSPSNTTKSPGEISLLAMEFQRLRLNDSSHETKSPKRSLSFDDSDSDSEKFHSAPSSPGVTVTKDNNNHGDVFQSNDSDEEDDFEDAEEEFEFHLNHLPCLRTPVQKLMSRDSEARDRQSRDQHVFLDGNVPTKLDLDVLRAVGDICVKEDAYPFFSKWRKAVTSFPTNEQNQWPSPARIRRMVKPLMESPLATPTGTKATPSRKELSDLKFKLEFDQ